MIIKRDLGQGVEEIAEISIQKEIAGIERIDMAEASHLKKVIQILMQENLNLICLMMKGKKVRGFLNKIVKKMMMVQITKINKIIISSKATITVQLFPSSSICHQERYMSGVSPLIIQK